MSTHENDIEELNFDDNYNILDNDEKNISLHPKNIEPDVNDPFSKKIWVKTFGCSHNISDGEYMKGLLSEAGYTMVNKKEEADLYLLNSCTVKDPSEMVFINLVQEAKNFGKYVVVAGCVPQADDSLNILKNVSVVGTHHIHRVVEAVDHTIQGNIFTMTDMKKLPDLDLPKVRNNSNIEILTISTGCLGRCTFCKTRYARGKLKSYSISNIINRIYTIIENKNITEIWMTSEDVGAYGLDIDTNIIQLLNEILKVLPPTIMLRIGMTNPPYILKHINDLIPTLKHPNVFEFIHIPVQSGSNNVLSLMKRDYIIESFKQIVDILYEKIPGITIATDIICGFSGEKDDDHLLTLDLINQFKFPIVNISQYYPRKGTPGAEMPRIDRTIVKNRSKEVTNAFKSYLPYSNLLNMTTETYICNEVEGDDQVGHTKSYVKVLISGNKYRPGEWVTVKIIETAKFHVRGEPLTVL